MIFAMSPGNFPISCNPRHHTVYTLYNIIHTLIQCTYMYMENHVLGKLAQRKQHISQHMYMYIHKINNIHVHHYIHVYIMYNYYITHATCTCRHTFILHTCLLLFRISHYSVV